MSDYDAVRDVALALLGNLNLEASEVRPKVETAIRAVAGDKTDFQIDSEALIADLETRVNTFVGIGTLLQDRDTGHIPWLSERRSSIDWKFSKRYQKYLNTRTQMSPRTILRSDELTDSILDMMGDPHSNQNFDRRGMAVGQVQSGKTSNYIELICKSADAGYKFIVILAGNTNDLRAQTQLRVDRGFLGWDTRLNLKLSQESKRTGVGELLGEDITAYRASSLTSANERGDFNLKVANQGLFVLGGDPLILIVKKNSSVLRNLVNWAKSLSPGGSEQRIDNIPFLLIDDEADWGSLNTSKEDDDPTVLNRRVRALLDTFGSSSYIGYTATPFANIFIPPEQLDGQYGDDLFPRDFLINLPTPSDHIGPTKIFGLRTEPGLDIEPIDPLPLIVTVGDHEDLIPNVHRKDWIIESLPESLRNAIRTFVLVCAARSARGQDTEHNSMLVHVTRFNNVQSQVFEQVNDELKDIQNRLRYGDGSTSFRILEELEQMWKEEFETISAKIRYAEPELMSLCTPVTWGEVQEHLVSASQKIQTRGINGAAKDVLDYPDHRNGLSTIAIGGDKLSRGLTLEGLSVSYYLRSSRMYDTLLQMGRWFGYRPGYVDLCRLYTTHELQDSYSHITMATEELRQDFEDMASRRLSPKDFGLRVRSHPSTLTVTATNKMRHGTKMTVSYSEDVSETISFDRKANILNRSKMAYDAFLRSLSIHSEIKPATNQNRVWREIAGDRVANFLGSVPVHEGSRRVKGELLAKYIRSQISEGALTNWTVVLLSNQSGEIDEIGGYPIHPLTRSQYQSDAHDKRDVYRIRRLLSPDDEMLDLDDEQRSQALINTQNFFQANQDSSSTRYQSMPQKPGGKFIRRVRAPDKGLLLLYPLRHEGQLFMGFGISFPKSETETPVEYVVNSVYWQQEFEAEA